MRFAGFVRSCRTPQRWSNRTHNPAIWGVSVVVAGLLLGGCQSRKEPGDRPAQVQSQPQPEAQPVETPEVQAAQEPKPPVPPVPEANEPISLFDGQTLGQWKPTDFGGQGDVYVKDGAIYMNMGNYMTGITWSGPVIRMNYEITLEATRVEGNDFFCGLTFPVADKPCTLVLGGWGGSLCGLSTIDYYDASENQTTRFISFEKGKWYFVRLRVVPDRIQAWLDGEELVNFETTDHKIGIRVEVDLSQPLGIATWMTTGAVRNIKVRSLPEETQ
jgi:hypothetical protein